MMRVIFCADPLDPRRPDEAFAAEVEAATAAGLGWSLVSFEELVDAGDAARATRRVPVQESPVDGMYRGWMLRPDSYAQLHAALAARGVVLLNDPAAYHHCHHFPESYPVIEPVTARSVCLPPGEKSLDRIMSALAELGPGPVILKDHVKSRKHEWLEACFIPSASDHETVGCAVTRFLELQGSDLARGLPRLRPAAGGLPPPEAAPASLIRYRSVSGTRVLAGVGGLLDPVRDLAVVWHSRVP